MQAFYFASRSSVESHNSGRPPVTASKEQRNAEFVDSMMAETGATLAWGAFNVKLAAGMLREAAAMIAR